MGDLDFGRFLCVGNTKEREYIGQKKERIFLTASRYNLQRWELGKKLDN